MKKLIRLELQKNNWKPYWITTSITTLVMLGFIYLIVLIPYLEPRDDDAVLFGTYNFVIGLSIDVMTGIFTIMSTTMLAKIIVEEYEKKAIVFFSYPIARKKFLTAKIITCLLYTSFLMIISGTIVLSIFIGTEKMFPLCISDVISIQLILRCFFRLVCYTMVTVFCSTVSLWIGFYRKSGIVTIVAACIIVIFICQIITMTFYSDMLLFVLLLVLIMLSFIAIKSMQDRVEKMEV